MNSFRLRRLTSLGLGGALLALGGLAAAQDALLKGPVIRFEERRIDFGDLSQATSVDHRFVFWNDGTAPLRISQVETSCGCTVAAPTDSLILPGESAGIEITFSTRDFQGDVGKSIVVHTNDPAEPRVELHLRANIVPFIRVESDWFDLGWAQRGSRASVGVLFSADLGTEFAIETFEGGEGWVDWKVVPASAPNEIAYRVEATLKPSAPFGPFVERVILNVHHTNKQIRRMGLRGNVYSYFRYENATVEFLTIKRGKTVRRSIDITADGGQPYQITDAILDSTFLEPQLVETANGYQLQVTLHADRVEFEGQRFPFKEFVRLLSTDPNQPEIVITVKGVIRG